MNILTNLKKAAIKAQNFDKVRQIQVSNRWFSCPLKVKMEKKVEEKRIELKQFKQEHNNAKVGEIKVDQVLGGMRGMLGMLYQTSKLHPLLGINYRDYDLNTILEKAQTSQGGTQPLPEAVLWLLFTGDFPEKDETAYLQNLLFERGHLSEQQENLIRQFPKEMHPMTQLSMGMLACQPDSKFVKNRTTVHKTKLWELFLEDALDVIAKVSRVASLIYHNCYSEGKEIPDREVGRDYAENLAHQLGYNSGEFSELMRLYLVIHADHEGGNVSAHASQLVGSALSDCYLSFSAAMNGLAGPLHGLANQECLGYLLDFQEKYGSRWNDHDIRQFAMDTLNSGKVIPGYGHAVLRQTDPRFLAQLDFAQNYIHNDNLINLIQANYRVITDVLSQTGKVKNPYPNVDAASGGLLMHYGLTQHDYYTVLFGVSRAFGVMPALVWSRALGLPIERPNSTTLDNLIRDVKGK